MYNAEDNQLRKTQVTEAIEKTLLEIGQLMLDKVSEKLEKDYNCQLSGCLENPEYLKHVLEDYFGDAYDVILDSLKDKLEKIESKTQVQQFLKVMAK